MSVEIIEADIKSQYNFSGIEILKNIPDSIEQKFKLPDNCEIYEYKW